MAKNLHIVSFDVPYPPNYGGVIDVYYKIKALAESGVTIVLHTFEYGRGRQVQLENYCSQVFYYPRRNFIKSTLSTQPFIVQSRANSELIQNLLADKDPILFEGLHTTFPLSKKLFEDRTVMVRTHNIEHVYYKGLSKSENRIDKQLFYKIEASKLKAYEKILARADYIFTIAPFEQDYFKMKYGDKASYLPIFCGLTQAESLTERGKYALFQGDLRISDNIKAAEFLIETFGDIDYPLIIASNFENPVISKLVKPYDHIRFEKIADSEKLVQLLKDAHLNVLYTFQKTGMKLKLISALFGSRHVLTNQAMVEGTGLEELCFVAKDSKSYKQLIMDGIAADFTPDLKNKRLKKLSFFDNLENAKKIIEVI